MFNFVVPLVVKRWFKIGALTLVGAGLIYGAIYVRGLYKDALSIAKENGRQEIIQEQIFFRDQMLIEQEQLNNNARQELQKIIIQKNREVRDLQKQLQIEHDLDRLLQAKPEWILKIVQKGTNEKLNEFEEITQWED